MSSGQCRACSTRVQFLISNGIADRLIRWQPPMLRYAAASKLTKRIINQATRLPSIIVASSPPRPHSCSLIHRKNCSSQAAPSPRLIRPRAAMRDLSCFGDGSVAVSAASAASVTSRGCTLDRSLQAVTTSVYNASLSSGKGILIRVTWSRSTAGAPGLTVAFDNEGLLSLSSSRIATQQHVLRKKRGSRSIVTDSGTAVGVHWDVTAAEYSSSPSPPAATTTSRSSQTPSSPSSSARATYPADSPPLLPPPPGTS
ncbi:hypothetical protein ACQJBY_064487 [Aegilops geniculata]